MRLLQIALAILLWLVLGYFVKPCWENNCNGTSSEETTSKVEEKASSNTNAATSTAAAVAGPLLFKWNNAEAILGDGWDKRRQALIDGLAKGEKLEITGNYRADETNNSSYDNLGLARAHEIAKLFKPPLTDDQIALRGQLVNAGKDDKMVNFKSASFRNLKNTESIKEIDDRTLIYFPFNSTNKLKSREVEAYLNDVADRVKKSGERVRLTGHTDSMSSSASNMRLGQRRANIVRDYLISRGVSASKIIAESKGETQPANGAYVNNKKSAENRRTELQIIK